MARPRYKQVHQRSNWNGNKFVMIAQWDSSLSVLPVTRVQFPTTAEYSKGLFPGWSHSTNPSWASVAENGSISPQWHHTTCGQRGGRPKSNHGQTIEKTRFVGQLHLWQWIEDLRHRGKYHNWICSRILDNWKNGNSHGPWFLHPGFNLWLCRALAVSVNGSSNSEHWPL